MCQLSPSSSESDESDDHSEILRAKWCLDDAATLDECVLKLENFIKYIKNLKEQGWELRAPVSDDYGFIIKTN